VVAYRLKIRILNFSKINDQIAVTCDPKKNFDYNFTGGLPVAREKFPAVCFIPSRSPDSGQ